MGLLTSREVCERLGINHRSSVYRLNWLMSLRIGLGPGGTGPYRWDAKDLDAAVDQLKTKNPARRV